MDIAGRGPLGQKAAKPVRGTKEAKYHLARVKSLPCVVCLQPGPSDAHHVFHGRYGARKASDFEVIPLCKNHHQGRDGIHTNKTLWADRHGFDYDFLPLVQVWLDGE